MRVNAVAIPTSTDALYRWASALAVVTIAYNVLEGCISVGFGIEDESLSLFGFGIDSFVEVISGLGVWHMIQRIRRSEESSPDRFERRALRITGTAFFILTAGLIATAVADLYQSHTPETTVWGIGVASVSIVAMSVLIHLKKRVGRSLGSQAIIADANCTRACLYLSILLLVASVGYELTGIGWIDSVGAIGIAILAFREGHESFAKAKGLSCSCAHEAS